MFFFHILPLNLKSGEIIKGYQNLWLTGQSVKSWTKKKKITFKTEDPPSHNKINKGAEQNEDDNYTWPAVSSVAKQFTCKG